MTNKLRFRLLKLLTGGAVVVLGVLLTAKAAPQMMGLNSADQPVAPDSPSAPSHHPMFRPDPQWRNRMEQSDQHFIVMMIPHHDDAIAMAELALTHSRRPEIKALARQIQHTQTQENQHMRTWYQQWYGTQVPEWQMGMGQGQRLMAGHNWQQPGQGGCMSSDLNALTTAPDFDRAFLEAMVPHHQMGVRMAEMVLARSDRPEIQTLATAIIQAQTAEIDQMQYWYQEWYPAGVAANLEGLTEQQ